MSHKILHVTECYFGGVGHVIDTISEVASDATHHLLYSGSTQPVTHGHFSSATPMSTSPLAAINEIRRTVRILQPDLVHAHSSWAGVYARALRLPVPVIYQPHCYKFGDPDISSAKRALFRTAEKWLLRNTHLTVILSEEERRLAERIGAGAAVAYVPNTAVQFPDDQHGPAGFEPGNRVLMIGRIEPQKDAGLFADTARLVRENLRDTEFVWIGAGDERLTDQLLDSGVRVTGWLSHDDVARELALPGVYFHTGRYEGFPLSLLNAAAFEHPVVVRDIPAFGGLDIPRVQDATSAAELLADVLKRGSALSDAVRASQMLNETMNRDEQKLALAKIYDVR